MNMSLSRTPRGGFTLVELLIVTSVFTIIVSATLGFMVVQNRAFKDGSERLLTLQNLNYASQTLEMDLRTVGSNVPEGQPSLVLVDQNVIAFTADHTSNVRDFSAVYFDPDAPDGMTQAPRTAVSLPNSSRTWPDTLYTSPGGAPSGAELIIFFLQPDTSTTRTDDFVLKRQVNGSPPEVLARDLLQQGTTPFFRYFRRRTYTGQPSLDSIPESELPLFHSAPFHGSAGDTASSAKIDSLRAVRVSFRSSNGREGEDERFLDLSRVIDLPNAGIELVGACGDEPLLTKDLQALLVGAGGEGEGLDRMAIQNAIDEFKEELDKAKAIDQDLYDVLEDVVDLLQDALEELEKLPPDEQAAAGKIGSAQEKVEDAIDAGIVNEGQGIQYLKWFADMAAGGGEEGPLLVRLRWEPSVDEASGENDVVRYLVFRREVGAGGDWGNPIVSIPAGAESYVYEDVTVELNRKYEYAHAAQDCTPSLSALSAAQLIEIGSN